MSRHDDRISLHQILDHAQRVIRISAGKTAQDIAADQELLAPAVIRQLEVIGEAASRVSHDGRQRHSDIPWRDIVDLRNRLIHGYDTIDYDLVRQIIDDDLPPLIAAIESILSASP
jgi:uncharacterized protein with HEPN domain